MTKGDVSEYSNLFSKTSLKRRKAAHLFYDFGVAAFKHNMLTSFRDIIYCKQ